MNMNANAEVTLSEWENTLEEKSVLKWKINLKNLSSIRTPSFAPMKRCRTKFFIEVWFQRINEVSLKETASIQVILRKLPESSVNLNVRFEFYVSVHYEDGSLIKDFKSDSPVELAKFTDKTCINVLHEIYSINGSYTTEGLKLSVNKLSMTCRMIFFGHIFSPTLYHNKIDAFYDLKKFTENFEALYESNELSDVSFKVGDKKFRSHKVVLGAHSPVFKRMLTQEFLETKTGVITISDFEPEIFEVFLKFFYTAQVEDKSFSSFKELYSLADKYDVKILKQECFKILNDSNLNEDQIDEVLKMAFLYNDDNLKKVAKQLLLQTIKKE